MVGGFEAMLPMIDQLSAQLELDEDGKAELLHIYKNWFEHDIDQAMLLREITELYRQTFTTQEVGELLEFYASPVGQKLVRETPALSAKAASLGMKEAEAKHERLLEKLTPFIERQTSQTSAFGKLQRSSQKRSIVNNLRMLSAAAEQYYLENNTDTAEIDDLVGPGNFLSELTPVDGEDYSELDLSRDTRDWNLVTESGLTVDFSR